MSKPEQDATTNGPAVVDRWWIDTDRKQREQARKRAAEAAGEKSSIDRRFFRAGDGYDQDRAHARLTDINLKILTESNPAEGSWVYYQLAERPFSANEREKLVARLPLPPYARGTVVDSGKTLRFIVTGTPPGARILELALGHLLSFDCWVDGEWVKERTFPNVEAAISAFPALIIEYLAPESIVRWQDDHVRA